VHGAWCMVPSAMLEGIVRVVIPLTGVTIPVIGTGEIHYE